RLAGERLLAEASPPGERRVERIAHHLFLSDRPAAAREHLLLAGERAPRSGAPPEGSVHLTPAPPGVAEPAERFRVLLQREQVWGLLAEREEQLADLRELASLSPALDDPSLSAEAVVREAVYLDATGKKRESLERYGEALALARRAGG